MIYTNYNIISNILHEIPSEDIYPIYFRVSNTAHSPTYPMHWHEKIEIQYIIEGTNIACCQNDIIEATEDSFYTINSSEIHQSIGGVRRHAIIQFSPSLFKKNNIIIKRLVRDQYLSEIMHKMIDEYYNNDEFSQHIIQGYAHLLIMHMYRNHSYKNIDYNHYAQNQAILKEPIKYIQDHYTQNITLQELATMANVSKYYFCNIFKEFTGQTFKDYLNHLRINKAIELLSTTDIPVTEIAFLCGFNDSNYFSRKFHQITGKTPLKTREDFKRETINLD